MKPLVRKALVRVVIFLMCGFLGGPLFSFIEYQGDQKADKQVLLQSLKKTMSIKHNMTAQEFDNLTRMSFEALSPARPPWSVANGIHFSFQTITTIGYGDITPVTQLGQILCIFFALVGIPITLLALKSVGELIKEGLAKLIRKFETKLLKREQVHNCEAKCAVVSFLLTVAMLCLGAGLSMLTSHWTFLEGIYFWFISFSTIGFGDYIPPRASTFTNASNSEDFIIIEIALDIFYSAWYLPCLCMVSSVISSIQDVFEKNPCPKVCWGCVARQPYVVNEESESRPKWSFRATEPAPADNSVVLVDMSNLEERVGRTKRRQP